VTRTYGRLAAAGGQWAISAEPHVIIRIKRIFPRMVQGRTGTLFLKDTPEVARDLEWLTERWPLELDAQSASRLRSQASQHRDTEVAVGEILVGQRALSLGFRQPARPPRPYQQQAADLILATGRLLLADDVGLGKTFSSLLVLRNPDALPALVVTLTHLPQQWVDEVRKSLPWLNCLIIPTSKPKNSGYQLGRPGGPLPDVLIMGYPKLAGWSDHLAGRVNTVIFDEIQELRRGRDALKGVAAAMVADKAKYKVGLSATPVYNYAGEIHNILEVLAPDALGSRNEFLREWEGQTLGGGRNYKVADPAALGTYLRDQNLLLRRTRKDVHLVLPDPIEIEQPVDTDHASIEQVAADVSHTARIILGQEEATREERWRAASDVDWRMRQATGVAKAAYVAEFVKLLLESEQKVVLFGWHREVYGIWLSKLGNYLPVMYTGSESPREKQLAAEAFRHGESRVLIMSLRSGAGLDGLQEACSAAVFGELDWSPEVHRQCVGRLARDGQESTVVAYYMVSDDGTDPLMAEVLGVKKQQAEPIRDPNVALFEPLSTSTDRARALAAAVLSKASRHVGGQEAKSA